MHASVHVKIAAVGVALAALIVPASAPADAWQRIPATTAPPAARPQPLVEPESFAAFRLDLDAISTALAAAPRETSAAAPVTVSIPAPDGSLSRFAVRESPVVEPGLARAHPGIRTYAGRGVDDPTATIRLDTGPMGFHASVRGEDGPWYVDPQFAGNTARYAVYRRGTLPDSSGGFDEVGVLGPDPREEAQGSSDPAAPAAPAPPLQRRNYRLALVTDPTYAQNSGAAAGLDPSDPDYRQQLNANVTAAKVTLVNRINQVYEADFNVRMVLIDATDELNLNTNALATGPNGPCGVDPCFTASQISTCGSGTLTRNSFVTGMIAGARNYDIGHIGLGTDGGGIAQLGVVGRANKSRGCTGLAKPIGDFFAIDYVAHEMGHEFGGNHTFNGTLGSCSATNRNATGETTVEPGSGITVMAYAGICDQDDLQAHSDPYFSQSSIDEMNAYMDSGPSNLSSVQQVALEGFDGTDSFRLFYAGGLSQTITRGTNYTAAGIKSAIEGTPGWPAGATVTVTGFNGASLDDKGFQVTFGGSLAGQQPTLLYLRSPSGTTGFVGETIAGGPTNEGGRWFTDTGNEHAPQVTTAAAHTIPVQTPFRLAAQGSDDDGDPVTYLWEQNDPGPPLVGTSLVDNTQDDRAAVPHLRHARGVRRPGRHLYLAVAGREPGDRQSHAVVPGRPSGGVRQHQRPVGQLPAGRARRDRAARRRRLLLRVPADAAVGRRRGGRDPALPRHDARQPPGRRCREP